VGEADEVVAGGVEGAAHAREDDRVDEQRTEDAQRGPKQGADLEVVQRRAPRTVTSGSANCRACSRHLGECTTYRKAAAASVSNWKVANSTSWCCRNSTSS